MSMGFGMSCPRCGTPTQAQDTFCPKCGADLNAEHEIKALHAPQLDRARKWILGVGILYLATHAIFAGITWSQTHDMQPVKILVAIGAGLFVIHLGLFLWAKKMPFAAAVVALVLFVTLQLVNAVMDPKTIYQGIVIKVLFIAALVNAVKAGLAAQRLRSARRG